MRTAAIMGLLRAAVRERGQNAVADEIGVARGYFSEVMQGRKPIGRRIPAFFGLEAVTLYEWKRPKQPPQ